MIGHRSLRTLLSTVLLAGLWSQACSDGGVVGGKCRDGLALCDGVCGVCGGDASPDADAGDAGPEDGDAASESDVPADWTGNDAIHPDGDAAEDGDSSGGDAGDAPDVQCTPPFNTPAACGDCFTQCGGGTPICSPVDGGYACVPACTPPLTLCGSTCVDLDTDPMHCGACNNQCPSGICQAGKCVGATVGHVVLLCMSYEQNFQSSPQTTLLGNAVFLPLSNPVRILAYTEHSPNPIENKVDQAIQWSATAKGRTFVTTVASTSNDVVNQLDKTSFDVLLVYDQTAAPAGALATAGTAWAPKVAAFVAVGGVVVVASGGAGTGEMDTLVSNAGLLSVSGQTLLSGTVLYNNAPFDAVGLNVLSPYLALKQSCTWDTSVTPGPQLVFVVGSASPDAGSGNPVVVHRIP